MKKPTINYATAWLMGIDLIATGKQLREKRQSHSLTQEELSECFERGGDSASRAIISMWENGKKLPSLSHMVFLAELYGCSLDELVISYRRSQEADDGDQPVPFLFPYHIVYQGRTHGYAFVLLLCIPWFIFNPWSILKCLHRRYHKITKSEEKHWTANRNMKKSRRYHHESDQKKTFQ